MAGDETAPAGEAPDAQGWTEKVLAGGTAPASENAPFIFFDLATCWGYADGVASITLEAQRLANTIDGVKRDWVVTGHLRMGLGALRQLRKAIDAVELLAAPTKAGPVN